MYNLLEKDMGLIVVFGGNDELQDYELAKFTALSSIDYRPQSGRVGVASDASKVGLAPGYFRRLLGVLLNLVKTLLRIQVKGDYFGDHRRLHLWSLERQIG